MRFIGFRNLSKHIKESDEKKLRKKAFINFQIEAFLTAFICNALYFFTRIDEIGALKQSIFNGLIVLSFLEIFIVFHAMPIKNKKIKETVMCATEGLNSLIKLFREKGINTTVENLQKAEISKSEKMSEAEVKTLPIDNFEIVNATKESIRIKTLEGEIKTLRQCKAQIIQATWKTDHYYLFLEEAEEPEKKDDIAVKSLAKGNN